MRSKVKKFTAKIGKVKLMSFQKAIQFAIEKKANEMRANGCKRSSISAMRTRVKKFVLQYCPDNYYWCKFTHDNIMSNIAAYLNSFQGKSKTYLRGVRSVLQNVVSYLPPFQLEMFGGVL
jgi:hypothetical protein